MFFSLRDMFLKDVRHDTSTASTQRARIGTYQWPFSPSSSQIPRVLSSGSPRPFLQAVIEHFIKVGGISSRRLPWDQIDKEILCIRKTLQHNSTDPKDLFWAYDYYVSEKGGVDTNGLGHKAMIIEGVKGVLIPSALPCLCLQHMCFTCVLFLSSFMKLFEFRNLLGAPVYLIPKSKITELSLEQTADTSEVKLSENLLQDTTNAICMFVGHFRNHASKAI